MRLREARIMPIMFGSHLGIWICRDRSIIWLIAEDPIAIMIRNKEVSEEFRNSSARCGGMPIEEEEKKLKLKAPIRSRKTELK